MSAILSAPFATPPAAGGNLVLDLNPATLALADGAAVSSFPSSVGAYTAVQATGIKQPLFRATGGPNGVACIEFDGSNDGITIANFVMNSHCTVMAVYKKTTASLVLKGMIVEHSNDASASTGMWLFEDASGGNIRRAEGSSLAPSAAGWAGMGTWGIVGLHGTGHTTLTLNGIPKSVADYTQPGLASADATQTLNIGSRANGASFPAAFSLARLLIWNTPLSMPSVERVIANLKSAYNLSI